MSSCRIYTAALESSRTVTDQKCQQNLPIKVHLLTDATHCVCNGWRYQHHEGECLLQKPAAGKLESLDKGARTMGVGLLKGDVSDIHVPCMQHHAGRLPGHIHTYSHRAVHSKRLLRPHARTCSSPRYTLSLASDRKCGLVWVLCSA